jgi:hypothetical protein
MSLFDCNDGLQTSAVVATMIANAKVQLRQWSHEQLSPLAKMITNRHAI